MMKKADCDVFLKKLQILRVRLTGEVLHLADEAFRNSTEGSSHPVDSAELGSDAYEQEVTIQMLQSEESALAEIDSAIERIVSGSYGSCERCQKSIPKPRLNAIPVHSILRSLREVRGSGRVVSSLCVVGRIRSLYSCSLPLCAVRPIFLANVSCRIGSVRKAR